MGLGKYLAVGEGVDDFDVAKEKFNLALHEVNLLFSEIRIKEEELKSLKSELADVDRRLESYYSAKQIEELLSPLEGEFASVNDELGDKKAEFSELTRLVSQNEALQEYLNLPQKPAFLPFSKFLRLRPLKSIMTRR